VSGGRITALRFTEAARTASPVQLRETVLDAYAEGLVTTNNTQANAVTAIVGDPQLAEAMRGTVSDDVRDRTAAVELDRRTDAPRPPSDTSGAADGSVWDFLRDPALDGEVVSRNVEEVMADTDWAQYRPTSDPSMWQYELEQQVASLSARAGDLRTAMEQVSAEAESRLLRLSVNAAGRLLDIRFTAAFGQAKRGVADAEFVRLYNTATAEASRQALASLQTAPHGDDDPTLALFAGIEATAQQALGEADRDGSGDRTDGNDR